MPKKKQLIKRVWLEPNSQYADSYVIVKHNGGDIDLKIADCNRTVEIGFNCASWSGRTKKQALAKLKKLRDALDLVEEAILGVDE